MKYKDDTDNSTLVAFQTLPLHHLFFIIFYILYVYIYICTYTYIIFINIYTTIIIKQSMFLSRILYE